MFHSALTNYAIESTEERTSKKRAMARLATKLIGDSKISRHRADELYKEIVQPLVNSYDCINNFMIGI
jgi:hypothetical protein